MFIGYFLGDFLREFFVLGIFEKPAQVRRSDIGREKKTRVKKKRKGGERGDHRLRYSGQLANFPHFLQQRDKKKKSLPTK